MGVTTAILALALVLAAASGWFAYRLLVDRGRLLLQIDALEGRLLGAWNAELRARGLPAGSTAPDFSLPDLDDTVHSLTNWRGGLVLVFVDPACSGCQTLFSSLGEALESHAAPGRSLVLVSAGQPDGVGALVGQSGLRCTLLIDRERRASTAYGAAATPSAYLVDAAGIIEQQVAIGTDEILELVGSGASVIPAPSLAASPLPLRPVSQSKLNRAGLSPGTIAPEFDLPRVDGGRLSLRELRGRWLLLVFSDPTCEPCNELAPQLERLQRESGELAVAVISRGDPDANRMKVEKQGLTYPVALQHHWSTSRDYGMFATPAGYLIDETGVIRSRVALGVEPILTLGRRRLEPTEPDLAFTQAKGGSRVA